MEADNLIPEDSRILIITEVAIWFIVGLAAYSIFEPSGLFDWIIFFIAYFIVNSIVMAMYENFHQKKLQKKFDENLKEWVLQIMEPTIGKERDWVMRYFSNVLSGFSSREYNIDRNTNKASFYINSDDGPIQIKFSPMFNDDEVCINYDVWYIFYEQDGSLHPDNQLFVSRDKLLGKAIDSGF